MSWSPEEIRRLRGERTRSELAAAIGVSELTIYRWELPEDAAESRRPRRASREKLTAFLASTSRTEAPVARRPGRAASSEPHAALAHLLDAGRLLDAEARALELLASGAAKTAGDRAVLQVCVASIQLLCRNDARGALATMASVLAEVDQLPSEVRDTVHAFAAFLYATPDGRLFDAGRAAAFASRVSAHASPDTRAVAIVGAARAAWHFGDGLAFQRRVETERFALATVTQPPVAVLAEEALALYAAWDGRPVEAIRRLEAVADRAQALDMAPVAARCLGRSAMLRLTNAQPPASILPGLDRAEQLCADARSTPGEPELVALAARAEALLRQGRFDEAGAARDRCERLARGAGWPPLDLLLCRSRLDFHQGGVEASMAAARSFAERWGHHAVPSFETGALFLDAVAAMCGGDFEVAAARHTAAFRAGRSGVRPWMTQLAGLQAVYAGIHGNDQGRAQSLMDEVEREGEKHPAPWNDLLLCHVRGMLAALDGRTVEAFRLYQSAAESLDRAGDVSESARMRRSGALAAWVLGEADAEQRLAATEVECERLGIDLAPIQQQDQVRQDLLAGGAAEASFGMAPNNLVIPFRRVSTRGFSPAALLGEIEAAARQLVGDPGLSVVERTRSRSAVSFGDGFGGRWFLVPSGDDDLGQHAALGLLATTAGLAMELATLRGGGPTPTPARAGGVLDDVIAASNAMRGLLADLVNVAASRSTVLIHGESGTGKEVVASAVHRLSPRASAPFVTFNSAAVPRELFEGQLFGYRKGAFTGATRDHPGVIRAADGGTLFLDEIGDMPLDVQAKLLRFLENAEVLPLGETRPLQVDVRVVAATHRDLRAMLAEGTFREDLYYRLQVVVVSVPPLRDRPEDIVPLALHFLGKAYGDDQIPVLTPEALVALRAHPWTGNARELRNVIERAQAFSPGAAVLDAPALRLSELSGTASRSP